MSELLSVVSVCVLSSLDALSVLLCFGGFAGFSVVVLSCSSCALLSAALCLRGFLFADVSSCAVSEFAGCFLCGFTLLFSAQVLSVSLSAFGLR